MANSNWPSNSNDNLIGLWVEVWVPEYEPDKSSSLNSKYHWQHVATFHGRVGYVSTDDEDDPTSGMAAFKVEFTNGDYVWCWRRELRPASKPKPEIKQMNLL